MTNFSNAFNTNQSDLLVHNGKGFTVIREINKNQYDFEEVGTMYEIEVSTGEKIEVFEDEITN